MFWIISFLEHLLVPATLRHAGCGVRSCCCCCAFQIASFLTIFSLTFVLCDVGHFTITQSQSVCVSCWSPLRICSVSRIILQIFLLQSLCNRVQVESIFHGLLLLWSIVLFVVTFSTVFGLILFEFEEFVDIVFHLLLGLTIAL